jgi:aminopeptidase N
MFETPSSEGPDSNRHSVAGSLSVLWRLRTILPVLGLAATGVWGCASPHVASPTTHVAGLGPPAPFAGIVSEPAPPPSIAEGITFNAPDAIEMGLPPEAGRYDGSIDVLHYDLELAIPPENDRVGARTTLFYQSATAGPHPVQLDLTGLEVVSVRAQGDYVPFVHDDGVIRFTSPGSAYTSDTLWAEVRTRGHPEDGLILRENVHGSPAAFADNWPNRARFWFPSQDHPFDKATVSFTVHAPNSRQVVANGVQVGEPVRSDPSRTGGIEGLWTWRWENRVPIPAYLMVVGVAELTVVDQGLAACGYAPASPRPDGCIEVTGWLFPPDVEHGTTVFARSGEMIDFYSELIGPFPYEKLANIQSSTRFGGMENASAIFYSETAIADRRDIEGTVAHEIAHQWFGNSVTPADWPHLWLSEGFASYFGPMFWEHVDGVEEFRRRIDANRTRYFESDDIGRPIVDTTAENLLDLLNRNSYQKGSLVLHMLRWVAGDDHFFEGVREYYRRHSGGNALTDDFRAAMEAIHGKSLEWFFDQWLHRPGYPIYKTEWEWDDTTSSAVVTIRQIQPAEWPAFRMPVEFEFTGLSGTERSVHVIEGREWTARIPLNGRPDSIRLDPDGWVLMQEADPSV